MTQRVMPGGGNSSTLIGLRRRDPLAATASAPPVGSALFDLGAHKSAPSSASGFIIRVPVCSDQAVRRGPIRSESDLPLPLRRRRRTVAQRWTEYVINLGRIL